MAKQTNKGTSKKKNKVKADKVPVVKGANKKVKNVKGSSKDPKASEIKDFSF